MYKKFSTFALVIGMMVSFSASAASAACNVKDERICAINAKLQAQVSTKVEYVDAAPSADSVTGVEYDYVAPGKHIIRVGDTRHLDDSALMFAVAHEYASAAFNHGRQRFEHVALRSDLQLSNAELIEKYAAHVVGTKPALKVYNHKKVYEADTLAVTVLGNLGEDVMHAMQSALPAGDATATHPTREARMAKAKEFLEKQKS